MCDCAPLASFPHDFGVRSRRLGLPRSCSSSRIPRNELSAKITGRFLTNPAESRDSKPGTTRNRLSRTIHGEFLGLSARGCDGLHSPAAGIRSSSRCGSNSAGISGISGSNEAEKYESLNKFIGSDELNPPMASGDDQERNSADASVASSFDFLELKRELEKEESGSGGLEEDELIPMESSRNNTSNLEGVGGFGGRSGPRGGRQVIRRSNLLAKQVISIHSACSLGFISQLWVNTRSWVVLLVEVRPNLLSGEIEKFLLEDVCQVGDVVLVQDETVMEHEIKMNGLDSLVGYNVITSGRHNVGKVRGYTFNIDSGVVESLELDSFGISIIPASLVSTYCLLVEDVLEVVSDTVIVHEGAVSRLQRLTKGIWNPQNVDIPRDEMREYSDFDKQRARSVRSQSNRKFVRRIKELEDDWELPMDY